MKARQTRGLTCNSRAARDVTGGSQGIGKPMRLRVFVREGAHVARWTLGGCRTGRCGSGSDPATEWFATCLSAIFDITTRAFCRHAVSTATPGLGGLGALVNVAGIVSPTTPDRGTHRRRGPKSLTSMHRATIAYEPSLRPDDACAMVADHSTSRQEAGALNGLAGARGNYSESKRAVLGKRAAARECSVQDQRQRDLTP